jgi:hypothetical protein
MFTTQNKYKLTLREWQDTLKPSSEIIYNCSTQDGSDGWLPFTIGIGYKFIYLRNEDMTKFQMGKHEQLVSCSIGTATDRRRRQNYPINRQSILKTLNDNGIYNVISDHNDYFYNLPNYKFIISPEGNGIDCHRHYEALIAGAIPIVEDNELIKQKYKNLPVLYTRDYSEITGDYLEKKYEEMINKVYDFSSLMLSSYNKKFEDIIKSNGNHWGVRLTGMRWYEN